MAGARAPGQRGVEAAGAAAAQVQPPLAAARVGEGGGVEQGEGGSGREDAGPRPEDEPGSGVVTAFGRQLKLLRVRAGPERPEFGKLTGYAGQSIASFEQGRRIPPPKFIDRADEVLDAGGVLKAQKEEVGRARYPAFFRDAAQLEAGAVGLCVYATHAVRGAARCARA
ncbi:helix-turn-helix domain-containing protein [Streptomyces sp. CA-106110]|uniref:helix-turn-helix domain-containing protein n=1 Tax=Streptomyces sp. CA-106110 TaxID=3240044 RepID=UPI003D8AF23B